MSMNEPGIYVPVDIGPEAFIAPRFISPIAKICATVPVPGFVNAFAFTELIDISTCVVDGIDKTYPKVSFNCLDP